MIRKEVLGAISSLALILGLILVLWSFFASSQAADRELDSTQSLFQQYLLEQARNQPVEARRTLQSLQASRIWAPLVALKSVTTAELQRLWSDGQNAEEVLGRLKDFIRHQRNVYATLQYLLVAAVCAVFLISLGLVFLGEQRRTLEARIRRLHQNSLLALEEERRALSRDLHDTVAQDLAAVKMFLSRVTLEPAVEAPLRKSLDSALTQVRQVAQGLRPATLDSLGFSASLRELCDSSARSSGFGVKVSLPEVDPVFPSDATAINLYRIVQEALQNAVLHSQARTVHVTFQVQFDKLTLSFSDDGIGFDVSRTHPAHSERRLGLVGMRERATLIGATLHVESFRGKGTRLSLELPL